MFFMYKKHNRYADKFEDIYPNAKQFYENEDDFIPLIPVEVSEDEAIRMQNNKTKRSEDSIDPD